MKTCFLLLPLCISLHLNLHAQLKEKDITGEYYLSGVMEVGSGFLLKDDHTFEFFFTYGALDRQGSGTWSIEGDHVILNSEPWPGTDFKMEKSARRKGNEITIQVNDKNTQILPFTGCTIVGGGEEQQERANQDGTIVFKHQQLDSILLFHQFFSDNFSPFPVTGTTDNYFEFTMLPHIGTVFFKQVMFSKTKEGLTGGNPLLEDKKDYLYRKKK